jgi:hypothetical protein
MTKLSAALSETPRIALRNQKRLKAPEGISGRFERSG